MRADEPAMDRRVLDDGAGTAAWHTAEATMRADSRHARAGDAMRFHVVVNHRTGEPKYPIGWPRTYLAVPADARDWSDWDFVQFDIYAETTRERLPGKPLGVIVRCPDRDHSYSRTLGEVTRGRWARVRIPTSELPRSDACAAIQFFISEADYRDGDEVEFWIDDLVLLRYAEPTILGLRPEGRVRFADAKMLRIAVELTGLRARSTTAVQLRVVAEGKLVRQVAANLGKGTTTVPLDIGQGLEPGFYQIEAQVQGSTRIVRETIRVISSPWQEAAR